MIGASKAPRHPGCRLPNRSWPSVRIPTTRVSGSGERSVRSPTPALATAVLCFTAARRRRSGKTRRRWAVCEAPSSATAAAELGVGYVELFDYPDGGAGRTKTRRAWPCRSSRSPTGCGPTCCLSSTRVALPATQTISVPPRLRWPVPSFRSARPCVGARRGGGVIAERELGTRSSADRSSNSTSTCASIGRASTAPLHATRASPPTIPSCGVGSHSKVTGRPSGGFGRQRANRGTVPGASRHPLQDTLPDKKG